MRYYKRGALRRIGRGVPGWLAAALTAWAACPLAGAQDAVPRPIAFSQTFAEPTYGTRSGYDMLSIANTSEYAKPGEPTLPARRVLVLLPPDADVQSVSAVPVGTRTLGRRVRLYPGQPPVTASGATRAFTPPAPGIYGSRAVYPAQRARVEFVSEYQGYRIAAVVLHPVSYVPADRRADFAPRIDLTLALKNARQALVRPERRVTEWVKRAVANPDMTANYARVAAALSAGDAEYLIVTREMFLDALKPLVQLKRQRMTVKVLTVEEIGALWPGKDIQEKIRAAVSEQYALHGTKWVLLAGDTEPIDTPKMRLTSLAASADAAYVAACSKGGQLYLWKSPGIDALWTRDEGANVVAMTPDAGTIAVGENDRIRVLDVSGAPLWDFPTKGAVRLLKVTPGGEWIAAADEKGNLYVCAQKNGMLADSAVYAPGGGILDLGITESGGAVFAAVGTDKGQVAVYRADSKTKIAGFWVGLWAETIACEYPYLLAGSADPYDGGRLHCVDLAANPAAPAWTHDMMAEHVSQCEIKEGIAVAIGDDMGGSAVAVFDLAKGKGGAVTPLWSAFLDDNVTLSPVAVTHHPGMLMSVTRAHFALYGAYTLSMYGGDVTAMGADPRWTNDEIYAPGLSLAVSADAQHVLLGDAHGQVQLFDAFGAHEKWVYNIPLDPVTAPAAPWSVPVRYSRTEGHWWLPTDFYYADLNGDWDPDHDGVYGEIPPSSAVVERDYFPEVNVGRFCAQDEETMRAIVGKTVGYALGGHALEPVALFSGESLEDEGFEASADSLAASYLAGREFYKYYAVLGNLEEENTDFSGAVAAHDPAVVYMAEHGSPDGTWFVNTDVVGTLENTGFLMFAMSCSTAALNSEEPSLGEAMLQDADGGAVGYVGGSAVISTANMALADRVFAQLYQAGETRQGAAFSAAKAEWVKTGLEGWDADQILLMHLLGDPELNLLGGEQFLDMGIGEAGAYKSGVIMDLGRPAGLEGIGRLGGADTADVYKVLLKKGDTLTATLRSVPCAGSSPSYVLSLHWTFAGPPSLNQVFATPAKPGKIAFTNDGTEMYFYLKVIPQAAMPAQGLYSLAVQVKPAQP